MFEWDDNNENDYNVIIRSSLKKKYEGVNKQKIFKELLIPLEHILLNLTTKNLKSTVQETIKLFDQNLSFSFNVVINNLVYNTFYLSFNQPIDLYFKYLTIIQNKEEEILQNKSKIMDIFIDYITKIKTQESYYLIEKMIQLGIVEKNIAKQILSLLLFHYHDHFFERDPFFDDFLSNYEELSKNDWELHKKYIKEGHNPNEIAKIIRNDEIEKLQEISSQHNFDFNQTIKPSLYERCSFINRENVTLIDSAAFFGSVKCFKYLLMNGSKLENAGKYAIAGGNEEIIHLCEQNHSSFENAYETAIMFHRYDIFKYLYENKIGKTDFNINNLGSLCITTGSYEILLYLEELNMKIDDSLIIESIKFNNLYLLDHFLQYTQDPSNIFLKSFESENIELVKLILDNLDININYENENRNAPIFIATKKGYTETVKLILEQKEIDVNAKDRYGDAALILASSSGHTEIVKLLLEQKYININVKNHFGDTALMSASSNGHTEIVKLLLEQKYININVKNDFFQNNIWKLFKLFKTALILASENGHTEIVKLLLEQKGIDINAKDKSGKTAFKHAVEKEYNKIVNLLFAKGAWY